MGYSNVFRPMGFSPYIGARQSFIVVSRPVPAARQASGGGNASLDIAVGDAYGLDGNGNAFRAGPNDSVRGIVIGFRFLGNANVMSGQGPISLDYISGLFGQVGTTTIAYILGCEDPAALFSVNVASGNTFNASNVGTKANLTDAAPDSVYAQSRQTINATGGGAQFVIEDIAQIPADNAYGTNPLVVVRMLQTFNNG